MLGHYLPFSIKLKFLSELIAQHPFNLTGKILDQSQFYQEQKFLI